MLLRCCHTAIDTQSDAMWLEQVTHYILAHRWRALALTFAITFIPVFSIFGILIAALMTLVRGVVEGAIFAVAATIPYIITFLLSDMHGNVSPPLALWAAVGVAVLSNVLTWVFAVMFKRDASWSLILQVAALFGVLMISVIHLAYPEVADWWGLQLHSYYSQAVGAIKSATTVSPANDAQLEAISNTKQYATGLMMSAILFNALLQLVVARWWQVVVFKTGNLRGELHRIRLSQLAGILFLFSLVFSYLGNPVVLDIMPILYLLFGVAGLSLVHYLFGVVNAPSKWFWLAVLYLLLIFAMPLSFFFLAILAVTDIWLDVRKRVKKV